MVLEIRKRAVKLSLLGMLCSETVGEGVGDSTSVCLVIPTYGHKQLSLCQACSSACKLLPPQFGVHALPLVGLKDISGKHV